MGRDWRILGEITMLQIQLHVMTGSGGYDTSALVECDRLRLTQDGVLGLSNGAWIVDRHHRQHPDAKYWHAGEALSFGFSTHYEYMWRTFRTTAPGRAGENVIAETSEIVTPEAVAGGLLIESDEGSVEFRSPEIAEPCVEFTRYMTDRPEADARELKPFREKLRNGVRGFVAAIDGPNPFNIAPGALLLGRPTTN